MSEDWNRNAQRTHRLQFLAGVGIAATAGALAAGSRAAKAQGWMARVSTSSPRQGRLDGESGRR